ncbi:beta-glucosidase [Altericroceibacterium endophyticum]|nr:glycoside hydrolase family 3 C-terminal domain-containing protein [Altericroceibacterium endophyticum]
MRVSLLALSMLAVAAPAVAQDDDPDARAAATIDQMEPAERTILTHGIMALPLGEDFALPEDGVLGAGYVPGISRLDVPSLRETDASLGVAWAGGARKDRATALPSAVAMGATWNPELMRRAGEMIGGEAHAKGFNVLLAGGINLMRDPRNGRTFEYFSEDPLLSGVLGGAAVTGIQSQHVISTLKHFALNAQETGRHFMSANISDAPARESDLLAFQIAIERGDPGSIMCAYNRVNQDYSCGSDYLLNQVLKTDWGYRGWVMSDWGAVHKLADAIHGLDQQSGEQLDERVFFGDMLGSKAASDPVYARRLTDMNHRILRSMYAVGVDRFPAEKAKIDWEANAAVARETAQQGIVLLRNVKDALPLSATARTIAVIGGYADTGVLSGGGSSQVLGEGPAVSISMGGSGPFAGFMSQSYQKSVPLNAIRERAPDAEIRFRNGRYITDAVEAARRSDVAIIFATQWMAEGLDVPDLSLPNGQDDLIAAVAAANPNTIVVLENGGPIVMPWLDQTAAVLASWYPGGEGADAIASILFGEVNPSGHLPVTFPANVGQLPRPVLPGSDMIETNFLGKGEEGQTLDVDYDIEGSDVGYRWFARQKEAPLFPFGFGLSYTSFSHNDIKLADDGLSATVRLTNSGKRAGADVAQIYLISGPWGSSRRLLGFERVELGAGESKSVEVSFDPRLLAQWQDGAWVRPAGKYRIALGKSAIDFGPEATITLPAARWTGGQMK